jgi:hypothetical protein
MARKRCRTVGLESLESRMCLSASLGWDGPGLGQATLGYSIGAVPESLDRRQVVQTLESALQVWSDVADIQFVESRGTSRSDSIDFRFGRIDGAGGALARAYLPDDVNRNPVAGDVEFDLAERWEVGNVANGSGFDLMLVAVHEIGHALGLEHTSEANSVMRAAVSARDQFRGLSATDVDQILRLYAPGKESAPSGQTDSASSADTNDLASDGDSGEASDPGDVAGTLPDQRVPLDVPGEPAPTAVPDATTIGQGANDDDVAGEDGRDDGDPLPQRDAPTDPGGFRFRFGGRWRFPATLSVAWRWGGLTIRFPNAALAGVPFGEPAADLLPASLDSDFDKLGSPLEDPLVSGNEKQDVATDDDGADEQSDGRSDEQSDGQSGRTTAGEKADGQGSHDKAAPGEGDPSAPSCRGEGAGMTTASVSAVSRFIAWRRHRLGN